MSMVKRVSYTNHSHFVTINAYINEHAEVGEELTRIANGFYFINIVLVYNAIETTVKFVQKDDHLHRGHLTLRKDDLRISLPGYSEYKWT